MNQTIPELIVELKQYDGYRHMTKGNYRSLIGNKDDLVKKLKQLKARPTTFHQFEELPDELQSVILSEHPRTLAKSQKLSKSVSRATKQAFDQRICTQAITQQDIDRYVRDFKPHVIYMYYNEKNNYKVTKMYPRYQMFYDILSKQLNKYQNLLLFERVFFPSVIENIIYENFIYTDLLTQYHIYTLRKNCPPQLSKTQILKELEFQRNQTTNVESVLAFHMYLWTNLERFPVLLPIDPFIPYRITIDDEGNMIHVDNVITHQQLNVDDVIVALQEDCHYLYDLLVQQIKHLI